MNDINDELLQVKIDKYCLDYPNKITVDELIQHIKYTHDQLVDFFEILLDKRKGARWILISGTLSSLHLVIDYLETGFFNIDYENNLFSILSHFGNELFYYSKKLKNNGIIQDTAELMYLISRLLGNPLPKKKFANSPEIEV